MSPPLAYAVAGTGKTTTWRISDEGHALLGRIMRANGRELQ